MFKLQGKSKLFKWIFKVQIHIISIPIDHIRSVGTKMVQQDQNIEYELEMTSAITTKNVRLDEKIQIISYLPGVKFWPGRTDIVPVGLTKLPDNKGTKIQITLD